MSDFNDEFKGDPDAILELDPDEVEEHRVFLVDYDQEHKQAFTVGCHDIVQAKLDRLFVRPRIRLSLSGCCFDFESVKGLFKFVNTNDPELLIIRFQYAKHGGIMPELFLRAEEFVVRKKLWVITYRDADPILPKNVLSFERDDYVYERLELTFTPPELL